MQLLKRVKWVYVLLSLFLIGVGVCLCLWPDIPSVTICCAIGGGAVLFGIVKIVLYFLHDIEQVGEQNDFAIGAICVIAGAILLIHPGAVLAMIPQVLGVYMLADSMFKLQITLDAKRLDNKGWWLALVITLICIVWGCLLIWQPFGLDRFLTALIAGGLIADGIQNLLGVIFCAATVKKTEAAGGEISEEPEPLIPPVFPVTPSEPVRPDPVPAAPVTPEEGAPAIAFEHVSFRYGRSGEETLTDIDFTLRRGQTLGILGETGSGKSTLIRLLMRFYDPDAGTVRLFGQDVRTMDNAALRAHFGVTFQSDTLFEDTIAENIRLGRALTDEQVMQAARDAQAYSFVVGDKQGFESALNVRGNNLSGGQKQRVMIARALCGHPDILVLDDASSALDYRTDAALRAALREGYADTTKVLVAQRISSVAHADLILVLSGGRVIARGTHETLLKTCELYQELYASQMGGLAQ